MGDAPTPAPRSRRRALLFVTAIIAVIVIVLTALSSLYTEVLWFREVHFSKVFTTMIWTRIGLGAVFGAVFLAAFGANLWVVQKITPPDRASRVPEQILRR